MKKNDLIQLLNGIKGNPDIILWNGMVGDYMNIKGLKEGDLVKQSFAHYENMRELDLCRKAKSFDHKPTPEESSQIKGDYRRVISWETNPYATLEDIKTKRYLKKRVVYIEAALRGVKTFDRTGSLEY